MPCIPALLTSLKRLFPALFPSDLSLLETVSAFDLPAPCLPLAGREAAVGVASVDVDPLAWTPPTFAGEVLPPNPAGSENDVGSRFSGVKYGLAVSLLGTGDEGALFSCTASKGPAFPLGVMVELELEFFSILRKMSSCLSEALRDWLRGLPNPRTGLPELSSIGSPASLDGKTVVLFDLNNIGGERVVGESP